jgi:poly(3-hydroxybutyrate) depolymerase
MKLQGIGGDESAGHLQVRLAQNEVGHRVVAQPRPQLLDVTGGRLLVPAGAPAQDAGWPLLVALHGAGGDPQQMLDVAGPVAHERGFLLLAVRSSSRTWDLVLGAFGPDVLAMESALTDASRAVPVDPARLGVC